MSRPLRLDFRRPKVVTPSLRDSLSRRLEIHCLGNLGWKMIAYLGRRRGQIISCRRRRARIIQRHPEHRGRFSA